MSKDKDKNAHQRKDIHLDLAKQPQARAQIDHPLDEVSLPHYALPQTNLADIDIGCHFLGKKVYAPFYIGAMTGGTQRADNINLALAEVANSHNIALAIGSQRATLAGGRDERALRKKAPDIPLIGNLGITQLAAKGGFELALRAIDSLEADAMAIHLNPLQEAVQPEGDKDWRGTADALQNFIRNAPVPVIIKEVGAGIHPTLAKELYAMGAAYIDIAGLGGTNWTRIEALRRQDAAQFAPFLDWGIDLVTSLTACRQILPDAKFIASGGLRHGLDVAKTLYLGADMACAAGPFLKSLEDDEGQLSQKNLSHELDMWQAQVKLSCFLTGAQNIAEFRQSGANFRNNS